MVRQNASGMRRIPITACYLILFLLSACLTLTRLDQTAFWDDEAQVGIIARNLVNTGRVTGWDGRNLFAYGDGVLLDRNLRSVNPPLDYLCAAASFRLFGVSTWAGRLPFALFGLASLAVLFLLLRREFGARSVL